MKEVKAGNIRLSTKRLYANLRRGATVLNKIGLFAERYFECLKEIEGLKEEITALHKTIQNNPRIETLSRTLEIRDRQIAELEKQVRLRKT